MQKGYDSEDFINKVMQSEEGQLLYSPNCIDMWLGADYVMQGLENDVYIEKGKVIICGGLVIYTSVGVYLIQMKAQEKY